MTLLPLKVLDSIWKPPQNEEFEDRVVVPTEEKRARAPPLKIPVLYSKVFEVKKARGCEIPVNLSSMIIGPLTPPQWLNVLWRN